ncbi:MAG: type II secretion system minor pseudopilin GspK [Nevskiales bacterium]
MAKQRQRQQGVALITAILIVALASIIATGMMASQNIGIHRSGNLFLGEQALWYSLGAENWATQVLRRDREDNEVDHYGEPWAQTMDYLPVEGGFLSGSLIDLQGRFNVNNLVGSKPDQAAEQFERLLALIEGVDPYAIQVIVQSARDWIDADIEPRFPEGAEDDYYLGLTPAYRTANRPFTSVSELLLVRGVTREIYQKIAPFLSTLPPDTPINVNTAAPEVLASLSAEISLEEIAQVVAKREDAAYEDPQDFLAEAVFAGRQIDTSTVSTDTAHFLLQAQAVVGTTRITLYSLLFRDQQGRTKALIRSKDLI